MEKKFDEHMERKFEEKKERETREVRPQRAASEKCFVDGCTSTPPCTKHKKPEEKSEDVPQGDL